MGLLGLCIGVGLMASYKLYGNEHMRSLSGVYVLCSLAVLVLYMGVCGNDERRKKKHANSEVRKP